MFNNCYTYVCIGVSNYKKTFILKHLSCLFVFTEGPQSSSIIFYYIHTYVAIHKLAKTSAF